MNAQGENPAPGAAVATDAHCHLARPGVRAFVCQPSPSAELRDGDVRFFGWHPWRLDGFSPASLRGILAADPRCGVGEIGLDRLRSRTIPQAMRDAFLAQLEIAAEFSRPVAVHGAKCWGETVAACRPFAGRVPAFLFHGFSRSAGLVPEIAAMNGFVSVGPAVLNPRAENYRALVRSLPGEMVLAETDATEENAASAPSVGEVIAGIAAARNITVEAATALTSENARRFASRILV